MDDKYDVILDRNMYQVNSSRDLSQPITHGGTEGFRGIGLATIPS